ncbi:FHA domain-containing protein [Rhizocola hellebori]|uniref:FHA domain-containing protein n=1 Tax=Rhizocola hellebori TaxID=1392758 RepID=UPI00194097B7|nr:FHA domain-containing protein [Rhizocola hellebori]
MHLRRDHPYCLHCGTLRRGTQVESFAPPQLRWENASLSLVKAVTTIGRGDDNDVVIKDASVSRAHARVIRTDRGFLVEDLNSFNGTSVGGQLLRGGNALLSDEAELHIGDVPVTFAQPRDVAIGGKTIVRGTEKAPIEIVVPTAQEPLKSTPRRRGHWALKQVPDDRGEQKWVLRNTRSGRYLELDERDVFLWERLDGYNTVRDLLFFYAQRYGELALPRIERTLRTFADLDLVTGVFGHESRKQRRLLKTLLQPELSIKGLDPLFARIYRSFGWWFFSRPGVIALWVLIGAGLFGMWVASGHQKLFHTAGAGAFGAVAVGAGYLIALIIHESAHALAVKSYGRKVTRGGFMLMLGMPLAFVDTSDMWFGSRWSRIVVTISGPLSTAGIAGACALYAAYATPGQLSAMAYQLAFGLYLNTAYNLNPLMPLDGYQAMADALRMPRLREQATAYFTKGFWADLRKGHRPGWRQIGMAAYGFTAVAGLAVFVVLAFLMWRDRLGGLVRDHLPPGIDIVVVTLGIGIVLFPIWYRMIRKLILFVKRRPKEVPAT